MILIFTANPPLPVEGSEGVSIATSTSNSFEEVESTTGISLTEADRLRITNGGTVEKSANSRKITVRLQKARNVKQPKKS